MINIVEEIFKRINTAKKSESFLERVFKRNTPEDLKSKTIVLFGSGSLGQEYKKAFNILDVFPAYFCDNSASKHGTMCCGLPIISFNELKEDFKDAYIVITSFKYLDEITAQLLNNGFSSDQIFCKRSDLGNEIHLMNLYANSSTMSFALTANSEQCIENSLEILKNNKDKIAEVYNFLEDSKSKELLITKLALFASGENYNLFKYLILNFSEPVLEFGLGNPMEHEVYYYFNNDVLSLTNGEKYVDIGAADGDTIITFTDACSKNGVEYEKIYAFEPDPENYKKMLKNTKQYSNISYQQKGLWSKSGKMRFLSHDQVRHDEEMAISDSGNLEIEVVELDEFLEGQDVTFIKMDPPGNVVPELLKGSEKTIKACKPKLALGAYHSLEAIFEVPLAVHEIWPDYKFYLRHLSFHANETDLLATL